MQVAGLSLLVWIVFLRTVTPLDFEVFRRAGRAVAAGRSPYARVGQPELWSGSAFVYPWLTAWLFVPASIVSTHVAELVMTALSCTAVASGVRSIVGPRALPVACVLFAGPTVDGLQMGTLNGFLFLGLCLAWRWRARPLATGAVLGALVVLKIFCWPLVIWLLITRRWAAAAWAVGSSAALLGAGWLYGPIGPLTYKVMLSQLAAHEAQTSSGFQSLLLRSTSSLGVAEALGVAVSSVLLVLAVGRSDRFAYTSAVAACLVASPVVWHHYYVLAAAPMLLFRYGDWWYLLVGWFSVPARASSGVSWGWLTTLAHNSVLVLLLVSVLAWHRRRGSLAPARRVGGRPGRQRLALTTRTGVSCVGVACIAWLVPRLDSAVLSVAPILVLWVVAFRADRVALLEEKSVRIA